MVSRRSLHHTLLGCVLLLSLAAAARAQIGQVEPGSGETERFLEVRRRQVELKAARAELKRVEKLASDGLISQADLEKAQTSLETAQLSYQESVLQLLAVQPRISIKQAVKHQGADGRKFVRLTVANQTPAFDDAQFRMLSNFEGADPIPNDLRTRVVQDIFLSLRDAGGGADATPRGTTIALPYEVHLPQLGYGEARTIDFELLRDVPSVTVAVSYKGESREVDVQLQQGETDAVVAVTASQISQEADLGSEATFSLQLDRSSVDTRSFLLGVVDLPRQISSSFVDPGSSARLSQIFFPAGVGQKQIELHLFLPDRSDEQVAIDKPLEFFALVMAPAQTERFADRSRTFGPDEIRKSHAGWVRLELIPRGVGKIEVLASNLFTEIAHGDTVSSDLTVRNTGTRRLDNVRIWTENPAGWRTEVVPDVVPSLDRDREATVKLTIHPPEQVTVGDYEVRIKTESYAYNRRVPSEDKIYRISVKPRANLLGAAALLVGLLVLVVGTVIFGIRLARR